MLILRRAPDLAAALGVPETFVRDMKRAGFPMPGYRATVAWALKWLDANPNFSQARARRGENCQDAERLTFNDRFRPPASSKRVVRRRAVADLVASTKGAQR